MMARPVRIVVACLAVLWLSSPAAAVGDPAKVIRDVFPVAETGFDPQAVHDLYSATVVQALHETLFTYDYLARPSKVVPLTAEAMPQISDEGRTWVVKLKKGILFTPDAAFKGKPRELVAEDYVYSLKRLLDPKIRSPWAFLLEGKIAGLDELAAEAKQTGKFDYDRRIPGLEAVDRHTIRIRLNATDYNLPYVLAHEPTARNYNTPSHPNAGRWEPRAEILHVPGDSADPRLIRRALCHGIHPRRDLLHFAGPHPARRYRGRPHPKHRRIKRLPRIERD